MRFLIGLLALLCCSGAWGAVATDATSSQAFSAATTVTQAHTCTGSNGALVVELALTANTAAVDSITYNGVAMTAGPSDTTQLTRDVVTYYLLAPATGAHNIVVNFDTGSTGALCAVSFTGVVSIGNTNHTNGTASSASLNITGVVSGDMVVDALGYDATSMGTSGTTSAVFQTDTAIKGFMSTSTATGTVTMSYTFDGSTTFAYAALNLQGGGSGVVRGQRLPLIGVGLVRLLRLR